MAPPMLILIVLAVVAKPGSPEFHKYPDIFSVSHDGIKTIIDPTRPLMVSDVEYYWSGYHQWSVNLPRLCHVDYHSEEWHLGKIRFTNGTEPDGVEFGCSISARCNGFECAEDSLLPLVAFIIPFVLGMLFSWTIAMACWALILRNEKTVMWVLPPPFSANCRVVQYSCVPSKQ